MTTKELINQYVTAHADNRWMDASELEALLTEFAEELKESASEDLEKCVVEQMETDGDVVLKVEYNLFTNPKHNNYIEDCWQVRVYEPIPLTDVERIN